MEKRKKREVKAWLAPILYFGLKSKAYEFIENLSYFLASGMPISDAINSLEEEMGSRRMRKVVSRIRSDIQEGVSLSESLKNQKLFDESIVGMVRSGELSGKLVDNLKLIIVLNDEDKRLKAKLNSSMLYGTIIIVVTIVVGIATAWFTLPKIASVYEGMGADLPFLTRGLVKTGNFFSKYGYFILPPFVFFIVAVFYFLFSFPKTKFIGHLFLFHLPLVGKIIRESEITRFGSLFGSIYDSGMPINQALEIMPTTTTFKNYKKLYQFLDKRVMEGISLSRAFREYKNVEELFPSGVLQMISSAEKTGKLSETLFRIRDLYGQKLESSSKNLPIIIEPVLLILVGIGVAVLLIATMLPIYNLVNII